MMVSSGRPMAPWIAVRSKIAPVRVNVSRPPCTLESPQKREWRVRVFVFFLGVVHSANLPKDHSWAIFDQIEGWINATRQVIVAASVGAELFG
jgi:hypothetical protein